jgi:hypothetical protein
MKRKTNSSTFARPSAQQDTFSRSLRDQAPSVPISPVKISPGDRVQKFRQTNDKPRVEAARVGGEGRSPALV